MDEIQIGIDVDGGSGEAGSGGEEAIRERLATLREKVLRDAHEIVEVLRLDLPEWVRREARDAFVESPSFAAELSDERVRAIKEDVEALAERVRDELVPRLDDDELWLSPEGPLPEGRPQDLRDHPGVWERIQDVAREFRDLLEEHGFPESAREARSEYPLPARFIQGRLLVSQVESYWRNVCELEALEETLAGLQERSRRSDLEERWDSA